MAKPEWWDDEVLKALSARLVRVVPDDAEVHKMRATVLCGKGARAWSAEPQPRSAAELREAATHFERAAALCPAPAAKAEFADYAARCRRYANAAPAANA